MVDTLPLGGSARASRFESEWRQAPRVQPEPICNWAIHVFQKTKAQPN